MAEDAGTIMLVDDDVDALALLSNVLERQGYRAFLARSGEEAVDLATEESTTIDTIVLDLMMPGKYDGYQVMAALKANAETQRIPIVVLSAKSTARDMARSYSAGAFQHLTKPYDIHHLSAVVESMVRLRRLERESYRNAQKYEAIIDYSPIQTILVSPEMKILEVNRSFRRRYPNADLGDSIWGVYWDEPPENQQDHPAVRALISGETERGEVACVQDGKARYLMVRAAPLFDMDHPGEVEAVILISMDMTEQRTMEENLKRQVERYNRALQQQDRTAEHLMTVQRELREKKQELERLSITDGLTALFNRRYFDQAIESEARRSARYEHPLTVMLMDIDHFKQINDTHGHPEGDIVLQEIARILLKQLRETDTVCRYGGEEFVVILPETDEETGMRIAERLRQAVEETDFQTSTATIRCTISIGVASVKRKAINPARLVKSADEALYEAKSEGRNLVRQA